MKTFALGCLIVVAGLAVVGGTLGYFFIWKPASSYVAGLRQLGELADIDRQVTNKASFTPPANGELTEQLVSSFVSVQEAMQARLGPTFTQLKTKYDEMERVIKSEKRNANALEGLTALKDLATIIVEAKHAQVEGLNQKGLSLNEYEWVRKQVYAAAGVALVELNVKGIAQTAKAGGDITRMVTTADEKVPARNKELVAPYAEKLKEWVTLGFFGL
jgi:hypothetical protein